MNRQPLATLLALLLILQNGTAFAQMRVAPVQVPVGAAAAVGATLVPVQMGGVGFQSQVSAFASLHAAQLTALIGQPQAAARYLESQRLALPVEPQAATAQLAALALVTRAIAQPNVGVGSLAEANSPALSQQLQALSLAVASGDAATGSLAPLIDSARRIRAEAEPALLVAHLFDGAVQGLSDGARLADGGWRTPLTTRLAAETPIEAGTIERLPPGLREKVLGLQSQRDAMRLRMKDIQKKGMELQGWGVPNVISIDQEKALRYARVYRMNGLPTDIGLSLHEVLAPLVEADPTILGRISQAQLHEAAQILTERLAYRMQPDSDDMQMQARLIAGARFDEGFDYPEQRRQLLEEASEVLRSPPQPGAASAGLGAVAVKDRPAVVMIQTLTETIQRFQELQKKVKAGEAKKEELEPVMELILALHAAMGLPLQTGPDQMMMVTVKHKQLQSLTAELMRREVSESVLAAVVRSFPLGESLWRMGIHKLWAQGITGKGIKIAILDNGVDFGHPDLQGSGTIFENMTYDRGDHTKGGHGTPMASIAHAIAPDAEIQSYQAWSNADLPGVVMNQQESHNATMKALDRAEANGADIISISGGFPMGYASDEISKRITELAKKGITVIVSAGNEGRELPNGAQVRSPATSEDAIAVGAANYHGEKPEFTSGGRVFNREKQKTSKKPNILGFGVMIKGAAQLPAHIYQAEPAPYSYGSGTSPAAPHISGVAALMLQAARAAVPDVAGPMIPKAILAAMLEAADQVAHGPLLQNAAKAIEAFVNALRPSA